MHLDSIGFLVKHRVGGANDGALRVVSIGCINLKAAPGVLMDVHMTSGIATDMIGVRSQHQAALVPDGIPTPEDLYIHVADPLAIPMGSMVTYAPQFSMMGSCVVSP